MTPKASGKPRVRPRAILQVAAPLVAIGTLMLGLKIGAKSAVRAAVVFGTPLPKPVAGKPVTLAWQMVTFLDDRGVRETVPMRGLTVTARARGQEARWSGSSNLDGIAEVSLAFDALVHGDELVMEVRQEGDPAPLATGHATWRDERWTTVDTAARASVRPTAKSGAIALDVVIEGGRLIPGFPTPLWVRTSPAAAGITITPKPEPGLLVDKETVDTCDNGWALVSTTAQAHVVGGGFDASSKALGDGHWFGALPVAPGAFYVVVPRVLEEGKAEVAVLVAPNPRNVVYAEIDDEHGRAAGAALDVVTEAGDPTPRARFAIPALAAGVHWLVVSGEPRGAEHLGGAAIARPFLVGSPEPSIDAKSACSVGPWLAQKSPAGFGRWVALDGLPMRSAANRGRHRTGMAIGLVALLAAAILEALLIVAGAREARVALQLAELDDDPAQQRLVARTPGGSLVIGLLVAVLGFALLAVLLVAKG